MDNSVVSNKMFLHRYTHLTLVWQVLYLQKTIPFYGTTWNYNLSSLQLIQALNIVMKSNLSFVFTILRLLFMHYGDLQNSFTLPPSKKPRYPSPILMILSWPHSSLVFEVNNVQGVFHVLPLTPIFTRPNISSLWNITEMHSSRVSGLMRIRHLKVGKWHLVHKPRLSVGDDSNPCFFLLGCSKTHWLFLGRCS